MSSSLKSYTSLPQTEIDYRTSNSKQKAPWWRVNSDFYRNPSFWVTTTVFFATLSVWLGLQLYWQQYKSSFTNGFNNELEPAKHLIQIEEKWFEGSPRFLNDGTEYVPKSESEESQYTGEPSRAIDRSWELLHWGRFFLLSEAEARDAWGPAYKEYWAPKEGGYAAALDVMHSLHCLDHLRKAYYPEIYKSDSPIHGLMHRDHCIDHLRQLVMCKSDLTPIPSRFYAGIDQNYIDSDRPHTCRNFTKIRNWVSARYNGTLAVPRADNRVLGTVEWGSGGQKQWDYPSE